ncbi:unnamed protein product [Cylindrotheca closterium]|uniref:Uncharacterized protein n=1 Tax=Cylindrotheca closterium TaxID=2856 RepID=A0AAD2PV04_9STRA|nr:unnamed protein product [Cylindrotheca closterium]
MMALWATKLSIGLDDDKPVACLMSTRTEIQLYLHGKKGGENERRAKSQEGPRADSRHGTDPQRRSFLSARSLDERRSGRSAGSNISRTVENFPFFLPEAVVGKTGAPALSPPRSLTAHTHAPVHHLMCLSFSNMGCSSCDVPAEHHAFGRLSYSDLRS